MIKKSFLSLLFLSILVLACTAPTEPTPQPISGSILDEVSGAPIPEAQIAIGSDSTTSGLEGRYELRITGNTDRIEVTADGYRTKEILVADLPPKTNLQELEIALTPYVLSGTVADIETKSEIGRATVTAGDRVVTTDDEGRYTIHALPPGSTIRVQADGYHPSWEAVFHGESKHDFLLRPVIVTVLVLDAYSGVPVSGVEIAAVDNSAVAGNSSAVAGDSSAVAGAVTTVTDDEGQTMLRRLSAGMHVAASRDGYASAEATYSGETFLTLELRPTTLEGIVRSELDGTPLEGALVLASAPGGEIHTAHTDEDGRFSLNDLPSSFSLLVKSAGYRRVNMELSQTTTVEITLEPFEVRGVYIPFGLLVKENEILKIIDLVDRTELNAIVLDVKGDRAWLAYPSELPVAIEIDAYANELDLMDLNEFLRLCQERGIYTIARIVVFKDNVLAQGKPEWAIHREDGELWRDLEELCWVDPFRVEVWDYNVGIAQEVIALGFDEVQFDYLRFPSDGEYWDTVYIEERSFETRIRAMQGFSQYVHQ
ncbi:MAG: putative glycoside hydrolase, partial [Chloroflexota bacterium]